MSTIERLQFWLKVQSGGAPDPDGLDDVDWEKLRAVRDLEYGDAVEITWRFGELNDPIVDTGYVTAIPPRAGDVYMDGVIFIPCPWVEKQAPEPQWTTIWELLRNPRCEWITHADH